MVRAIIGTVEWTVALAAVIAVWLVLGWAGILASAEDGTSTYDPAYDGSPSALCSGAMGC